MVSSEEQDTERVGGASASGARVQKKRPAERPPSNVESEDEGAGRGGLARREEEA